ncbi:MAG TPA: hypothetical protein VM433_11675 [Mycobacteriales bacterium]|nr:hypothetical protein [Mycobacteriales bacterium]
MNVKPQAPAPAIRTRVPAPLPFADGRSTTAEVLTFHGLVDGREHLALAFGDWQGALAEGLAP